MPSNLETIETWFRRVWAERDKSTIDEMFIPVGKAHGLGNQTLVGPEDFKPFHTHLCALFDEITITVDKYMEDGDWVAALCTFRAKRPETPSEVSITGSVFMHIRDGIIIEAYNHWDFMGLFEQIDLLPKDTFDVGMAGNKIA